MTQPNEPAQPLVKPALYIVGESEIRVWHEALASRLERGFARAGIVDVISTRNLDGVTGDLILASANVVLDTPVIEALATMPDVVLLSSGSSPGIPVAAHVSPAYRAAAIKALETMRADDLPADLNVATTESLGSTYWHSLRKREVPYALVPGRGEAGAVEWRMFLGTYKGATDIVTKWIWPRPAFYVTKLCSRVGLTPNIVTTASLILVIAALYWFYEGQWLAGLASAWAMTFLDTVDGKLARVTLTSSKWGNIFDHGIDLIHPPFWYAAWGLGLGQGAHNVTPAALTWMLTIIIGGYVLQRAIEGISIAVFKLEIHVWRRIDTLFRQITARRNPNLLLLTLGVFAGRPDIGLFAVAAWTGICLAAHGLQLGHAYLVWRRTGRLTSWMAG